MTVGVVTMLLWWGDPVVGHPACHGSSKASREASGSTCLGLKLGLVPEVRAGEPVELTLELKNLCDHPLEFFLGGRPAHDFVVTTPEGLEVWRWLHQATVLMILDTKILYPDETLTFTATWDQRDKEGNIVAPGDYGSREDSTQSRRRSYRRRQGRCSSCQRSRDRGRRAHDLVRVEAGQNPPLHETQQCSHLPSRLCARVRSEHQWVVSVPSSF